MIRYNLKPMLKKYGITQTELMKKLHISSTTMAKFKKNEPVSLTVIDAICTELGCSISDLITIERQNSILLQRFLDEKKIKLSNGLYHEVQILFAYNSNRIEGSKLSKDETRYIYETNTIDGTKNVNDIIEHSLRLIRQDANAKRIRVEFTRDEQLPNAEIDPDRFTQALLNLYLNAVQAMENGGILAVRASTAGVNEIRIGAASLLS